MYSHPCAVQLSNKLDPDTKLYNCFNDYHGLFQFSLTNDSVDNIEIHIYTKI